MPKWGNQDYKQAVFEQLAKGADDKKQEDRFEHFENFSSGAPRSDVERGVGEAFHPERLAAEVTKDSKEMEQGNYSKQGQRTKQ